MKAHYWFILFLWVAVRMEAGGKMAVSSSATEILLPFQAMTWNWLLRGLSSGKPEYRFP